MLILLPTALYCSAQHISATSLHSSALLSTPPHCTPLLRTALHSSALLSTAQWLAVLTAAPRRNPTSLSCGVGRLISTACSNTRNHFEQKADRSDPELWCGSEQASGKFFA